MQDADGFDTFYRAQRLPVLVLLYAAGAELAEACEVCEQAFARAWQRWPELAGSAEPAARVRTVARHLQTGRWHNLRGRFRLRHRRGVPGELPELSEDTLALVAALGQLPVDRRLAIVLHHLLDLPVDRVATELRVATGTVQARLAQGRTALTALLSMADLAGCADSLRHDLATVPGPDPRQVRRAGGRRTALIRLGVAALVAALVLAGGLVSGLAMRPPALSAAPPTPAVVVPPTGVRRLLLTPADLGYGFRSIAPTFEPPAAGAGPLGSCHYSTLPAAVYSGQITIAGYRRPGGGEVTEWLVDYRPGGAIIGIRDEIRERVDNPDECGSDYRLIAGTLDVGDASILLAELTGPTPPADAAVGTYEAFVAQDDYLIWVRVAVDLPGVAGAEYARQVAGKAAARVRCALRAPAPASC